MLGRIVGKCFLKRIYFYFVIFKAVGVNSKFH